MKKNIFLTTALAISLVSFSSCEDFLTEDNPNKIPVENYFSSENDVERAVNGAYTALRSGSCMGEGSTMYTEERSDNMGRIDNQSSSGEPFQFTDFSLLPSNTYLKTHWTAMYKTVTNCNFAIKGANTIQFEKEADKLNYIAEAKFVRALAYFDIVRKWGDAPLVTDYLTTPTEVTAQTVRVEKAKVYEQIVQDLKDGLDSTLPNHQPEGSKGHANKAAISGLLGKVYLTMAAALESNKAEYLNNAKTYLTQCYNMKSFGELKDIPYEDVFDVSKKSTCSEILFQIVYIQGDIEYSSSIAKNNQPGGITDLSLAKTSGRGNFVNADVANEYEEGDLRKTWSVAYVDNSSAKGWYVSKYRDTSEAAGTLGYGGNNWTILRYADVILMLAEVNEALGQEEEAISFLNQVRDRAGLPNYQTMQADADYTAKYPTLKLAILHERRSELAFENQRWYDLLRFFSIDELITYMHNKNQDDYGISNLKNFGKKDIYYPIPYDEWKLNPEQMYQNEGY